MLPDIGELAVDHVLPTLVLLISKINTNLFVLGDLTQLLGDMDNLAGAVHTDLVEVVVFALEYTRSSLELTA